MKLSPTRPFPFLLLTLLWIPAFISSCAGPPLKSDKRKRAVASLIAKAHNSSSTDQAIAYLEKAVRLDTLSAEARIALAGRYESMNHEWKAESELLSGYSAGIREPALLYHLGRIGLELNKFTEAAFYLDQIPCGDSLYLPAVFLLARTHILRNDFHAGKKRLDTLSLYDSWKNKPDVQSLRRRLGEKGYAEIFSAGSPVESIARSVTATRYDLAVLAGLYFGVLPDSAPSFIFEDIAVSDALYPACAAAVQTGFLEALPDGKFHPRHRVKKRNLAYYLYNWLKTRRFDFGVPAAPSTVWKDIAGSDPHYAIFATMAKFGIVAADRDTVFGADQPVSGKEAVAAFERAGQLLNPGN